MNAIHAIEASDRSCFRVGAVSQRGPRKNRKPVRYGNYNLTTFDVAATYYPASRQSGSTGTAISSKLHDHSTGIQGHSVNFGRNISFRQNRFNSVCCIYVTKLIPLRGKPKQGIWHNFARPDRLLLVDHSIPFPQHEKWPLISSDNQN